MIISFNDVVPFKKEMKERFGEHDQCGAQYFHLENHTPEIQQAIEEYFAAKNINVVFSGMMFRLMSEDEFAKINSEEK